MEAGAPRHQGFTMTAIGPRTSANNMTIPAKKATIPISVLILKLLARLVLRARSGGI
jgi:hypothetical protein